MKKHLFSVGRYRPVGWFGSKLLRTRQVSLRAEAAVALELMPALRKKVLFLLSIYSSVQDDVTVTAVEMHLSAW